MTHYICTTCGTQFDATEFQPKQCPICEDERQYINPGGQQWTTLDRIQKTHKAVLQKKEENLYGIGSVPQFGIGQRALLVLTPAGNLLWDCISFLDDTIIDIINALGGLDAIAISHPHYYTTMAEWSLAFGHIPIYIHEKDRQWVQRSHPNIQYWGGPSKQLWEGLTLYNLGGHFEGSAIAHWQTGAGGKGALLTGDILQVVPDRQHVSFMYSYPNHIPLNRRAIERMANILKPLKYDRIYGAWWGQNILSGGKQAVSSSVSRYLSAIQ